MPWYTNHIITCKVLNRIANRYDRSSLQDLHSHLDKVTELLWRKQEQYFKKYGVSDGLS
jgi:arsenate reductase-like glutaredoxin family protein